MRHIDVPRATSVYRELRWPARHVRAQDGSGRRETDRPSSSAVPRNVAKIASLRSRPAEKVVDVATFIWAEIAQIKRQVDYTAQNLRGS